MTTTGRPPTVSVTMPVYNASRYVGEAVESILAQTFGDFELLILDDGSTDRSAEVLRDYAGRDGRVRLVSRPNRGIAATLNELVGMARGELLARMDADDVALPGRLERQVAYLRSDPSCLAVGSRALVIDPDGDPLCEWWTLTAHEEIDAAHISGASGSQICHPSVMLRRAAVEAVGGYVDRPGEDLDLFLKLAERGRLANLPDVLVKYRLHPSSLSADGHRERARRSVRESVADARRRRGLSLDEMAAYELNPKPRLAEHHRQWGWQALTAGYIASARKHAASGLIRAPLAVDSWRLLYCAMRGR